MAPTSCAMQNITKRTGDITPHSSSAKLTFGLNNPPVTRKNIHAEMSKLSPITCCPSFSLPSLQTATDEEKPTAEM